MRSLNLDPFRVDLYEPDGPCSHLVYLHASPEDGAKIWQTLSVPKPALAIVSGTDWNRDFSPWPAPRVFARGEDFPGGAEAYLARLTGRIIPAVESALPHPPSQRCIAGYSLAGLFALWCAWRTDIFDGVAALSPSVWFDGFADFTGRTAPARRLKRVCLSLGDREKRTRNARMATVETALMAVRDRLVDCDTDVVFHFESGGHFDDVSGRVARGIARLCDGFSM